MGLEALFQEVTVDKLVVKWVCIREITTHPAMERVPQGGKTGAAKYISRNANAVVSLWSGMRLGQCSPKYFDSLMRD